LEKSRLNTLKSLIKIKPVIAVKLQLFVAQVYARDVYNPAENATIMIFKAQLLNVQRGTEKYFVK